MNPFKGRHFQRDIILWAVRRYSRNCRYHQACTLLFLLPVDDLGASHTSTFEPNEAVTLSSELTAAGSRCDFREGMPVTTSKNKITRFSASDRQPVRMRFTKKNISSIQWRFLQFSDEARI